MLLLIECIENAFKTKTQLIIIAIDYRKAYDSVKREKMVEALKYYKIDSDIIDSIVEIYKQDETKVKIREDLSVNFEVKNGIRQGCT